MYLYKIIRNITGTLGECGILVTFWHIPRAPKTVHPGGPMYHYTRTFRSSSIGFSVLLYVPLLLSFVAMPSLCCFLRVTPKHLAEQYNTVLSLYYCPILKRTVFAVGAMVTDAVRKVADKQIVIKFKQWAYNSWSQAREAYRAVSRSANVNSVWNQVFVAAEDI